MPVELLCIPQYTQTTYHCAHALSLPVSDTPVVVLQCASRSTIARFTMARLLSVSRGASGTGPRHWQACSNPNSSVFKLAPTSYTIVSVCTAIFASAQWYSSFTCGNDRCVYTGSSLGQQFHVSWHQDAPTAAALRALVIISHVCHSSTTSDQWCIA